MMQLESSVYRVLQRNCYYTLGLLRAHGWSLLGALALGLALWSWLQPRLRAWASARADAAHHKDPDTVLSRERALRTAREAQQRQQQEASRRAAELRAQREETKRREAAELLERSELAGGSRLGADDGYLPLSGGGGMSSYRAPKRSACARGGCGR